MKKLKILPLILHAVGMATVVTALIIGNDLTKTYELAITTELCPEIVDEEEMTASSVSGQEMSALIVEEGAVLLKNDNNVLPFSKTDQAKVNVFGWRSIEWAYGSVGSSASGAVNNEENDPSKNVDFLKALNQYGIEYNTELIDMYKSYYTPFDLAGNAKGSAPENMMRIVEPPIDDNAYYTDSLLNSAKAYSDTAIVVIGRLTGENWNCYTDKQVKKGGGVSPLTDTNRHYLEITTEEEKLLTYVGANFENVLVVLNTGNIFELGFLDTIPGLDACMFAGYTGTRGGRSLPKLIYGEASPSGHLVDTYPYDLFTNPSNIFANPLKYSDYSVNYLDLIEGIYVGYKWYETADAEGYWDQAPHNGYESVVQFPFGYGLSYSTFDWTIDNFTKVPGSSFSNEEKFTVDVTVTNTGDVPAKEVVQLYMSAPYYEGQIEKASVNLIEFAKTHVVEPGKSETLTLEIDPYDFASYDCYDKNHNDHKGYELDAGDYTLSFRTNAHTVKTVNYDGASKEGKFTFKVDETINYAVDPVTKQPVGNLFTGEDAIDTAPIDGKEAAYNPEIPWLSRANFPTLETIKGYYTPRVASPNVKFDSLGDTYKNKKVEEWDNATTDVFGDPVDTSPTTWGAKNGLSLTKNGVLTELGEQLGENYDDPQWEPLLAQLSKSDVYTLINNYYGTPKIDSIGKVQLIDYDGPAQVKGFRGSPPRGVGFPIMTLVASTFNPRLAYQFGKAFGDSTIAAGVNGVWGWAIDNHRSAFFSRANESPSEDPVLAGKFIAQCVKGFNTRGRYCFLKHFCYYLTGWNHRSWSKLSTCVYSTEQALRETTLKAYRYAFVEGGALGCMTSYEGVGVEHSETTEALLNGVLRKEWQFKGAITTDYVSNYGGNRATNSFQMFVRVGGNLGMGATIASSADSTSPRYENRLKQLVKEVLWTWLRAEYNSRYYAEHPDTDDTYSHTTTIASWVWWKPLLTTINAGVIALVVIWAEVVVLNRVLPKKRKEETTDTSAGGGNE